MAAPSGRPWDASIGFVATYGPGYSGAATQRFGLAPGFYVRYGRVSIATRGGFVSRSTDPNARGGLRIDLSPSVRWRVNLGLRYDAGRAESSSEELRGMGDIPATVRVRLTTAYALFEGWHVGGSVTVDASGRGGGYLGDVNVGRDLRLTPATTAGYGLSYGFAGDRYLQTYYGVTAEQAARTGYPVYEPHSGARDISASVTARTDLGWPWAMFYGGFATHLVGPTAASPLTRKRDGWGINAGLVYRF